MQRHSDGNLHWLEFDLLSDFPNVKHQMYLRSGGISEGPYSSLNVGLAVGDRLEHVQKNLNSIENHLQKEMPQWQRYVWGNAIHGTTVKKVNAYSPQEVINVDGLSTDTKYTTLLMKNADCQIALFYDPKLHVAANVHSGWRGSVANIYEKTVQHLMTTYGCQPANLLVCITPSLGPDEAEFISYQSDFPQEYWQFQVRPNFFDFWSITEYQLQNLGILPHHIEIARQSTFCNPKDFFSYRRERITGRHATCITLF